MSPKVVATSLALALCACAQLSTADSVPDPIKAGANESVAMSVAAQGVQIYECRAKKDDAAAAEWVFVAPEADMFDARGRVVGKHYGGPHWESLDGSRIAGTTKARLDAPQAGSIPWLLLAAKSVGREGVFSKVTSVQRVNTAGGVAPDAAGCSQSSLGTVVRVPYTATYVFLAPRSDTAAARRNDGGY
jgi:hypothetical protein